MASSPLNRVLILGASGYIGRGLVRRLGDRALPTFNSRPIEGWVRFNALTDRVADLDLTGIRHAVVLVGNANPDSCARDRAASDALNVDALKRICDELGQRGIHMIFSSTEVVFDGIKGDYVETDPVNPTMVYGAQKLEIERHLAANWPHSAVIRIAKVYGTEPGGGCLLDGWYRQALGGGDIRCAADFISSVIHIDDVVDAILAIFNQRLAGIYHLGGPVGVSRLAMFQSLLAAMAERGPVSARAVGCSIDDFPTLEGRPKNLALDATKLVSATGLRFRRIEDACREFVAKASLTR